MDRSLSAGIFQLSAHVRDWRRSVGVQGDSWRLCTPRGVHGFRVTCGCIRTKVRTHWSTAKVYGQAPALHTSVNTRSDDRSRDDEWGLREMNRQACRQRSKRSPVPSLERVHPKGDHPKDWRAPTRKLDRQALYFLTLLARSHSSSSSVSSCSSLSARWSLPSPSTLTKEFVETVLGVISGHSRPSCSFHPASAIPMLVFAASWGTILVLSARCFCLAQNQCLVVLCSPCCFIWWALSASVAPSERPLGGCSHGLPASLSSLGRGATRAVGVSALSLCTRPSALPSLPRAEVAGQPESGTACHAMAVLGF